MSGKSANLSDIEFAVAMRAVVAKRRAARLDLAVRNVCITTGIDPQGIEFMINVPARDRAYLGMWDVVDLIRREYARLVEMAVV